MKERKSLDFRRFFKHTGWLRGIFSLTISGLCLLVACKDDTISPDVPLVVVGEVTDISNDGATFHGLIVNEGPGFSEVGFVWDESAPPGYAPSRKVVPVEKGIRHFSARISADHQSGKEYTVKAYLKTGEKFTFSNAVKFTSRGSLPPVITDFSPKSGLRNTEVTIHGRNFSNVPSHIIVKIGEITAIVTASNDSTITVKLPQNVYASEIGKITVSVLGKSTVSTEDFEFGGVFIESFSPKTTSCYGKITITGQKFTSGGYTEVNFRPASNDIWGGKVSSQILRLTDTEIDIKVPVLIMDEPYRIVVYTGGYEAESTETFIIPSPKIYSISALEVEAGDTLVINGTNFGTSPTVRITWWQYVDVISSTDSQIIIVMPEVPHGSYDLTVINDCQHSVSFSQKIQFVGPWVILENVPISSRNYPICHTIGDLIYIGLGQSNYTNLTDLWEYNTSSNLWKSLANFPGQARDLTTSTVHNGHIMVWGGYTNGQILSDFWLYNPTKNEWKELSPYPGGPRYAGVIYSINGKVYAGLGWDGYSNRSDFYEYDPDANSWLQLSDFQFEISNYSPVYFTKEKGYCLQYNTGRLYEFDPAAGWSYNSTLSSGILYTLTDEDDIIFLDNEGGVKLIDFMTWDPLAILPSYYLNGYRAGFIRALANDRLYIGLGQGHSGSRNDIIYLDLNDYR